MTTEPQDPGGAVPDASGQAQISAEQKDLDAIFAAARDLPEPSADLMARVLADAAAVQAERAEPQILPYASTASASPGFWAEIRTGLGGWLGLGGLAAAGLAGLALGVALPAELDVLAGGQISAALGASDLSAAIGLEAVGFAIEVNEP